MRIVDMRRQNRSQLRPNWALAAPGRALCGPAGSIVRLLRHLWDSFRAPACTLPGQHDRLFPAQKLTPGEGLV